MRLKSLSILILACSLAQSAAAYTIYLKDGSRIIARDKYEVQGDKAIITLENGTQTFLAASEIDVTRTEEANLSNLGGALIFEDGQFVERTGNEAKAPKRETVSDLIARGEAVVHVPDRDASAGAPVAVPAGRTSIESITRQPMRDIALAAAVKQAFVDRNLEGAVVYQGTEQDRPLIEFLAESEAAVFRDLEAAAEVLLAVSQDHPQCAVMELLMKTASHERAGEFELTLPMAERIKGKKVDLAAFFVDHVRF
jgi:hypothetical protein